MLHALRCLAVLLLLSIAMSARANGDAQTAWRLLDYVAVDYREAVKDGQVVNDGEYAEMIEFSESVRVRLTALPATAAQPQLIRGAEQLQALIAQKAAPETVARRARYLAGELLAAYPMPVAPATAPDGTQGAVLYQQQCAGCHGVTGAGNGPAAAAMDPPPIDFTDHARARERSVFALYQVIEQGLEGTAMASYATLSAADRWALAFRIGQYAYPDALVAEGERLWSSDSALRGQFPNLQALTQVTPAALAARIGEDDARALTAYLRRHPQVVQPRAEGSLALARARLAESAEAYEAGDRQAARDLALSAYLDGFEPVEPLLASRDPALMARIEGAMAELRARIGRSASAGEVQAQVQAVDALFGDAEAALSPDRASNVSAFVGAFTILLREGLEALLVLIAIVAFLRKAGRTEVLPYVHAGWVAALLAGVLTWGVATYLVGISGASRELTEGFAALFAAGVL
ncbi:MAG: FTR1 family protein, partial [Gammaproteobacteria bacterium]|nr:FTR1 family protein [Gammaproteobacteria bacterium]